uniref:Phospholipase-like protein n=1 Tax=Tanacetum cinerariifolium TaxID=118510 RepID=A0A6L2K8J7_TANCI|nr:hypothetical protein [Tanacetum cinerariifolium]
MQWNGDIPFRNRLFPEKIGYDVKIIDLFALFDDEEIFSKLSDEDTIQLCLLLSLEGEHIWRQLYDSIRNVSSKHMLEYLAGFKRNPNHVPSYLLTCFLFAFKIWIIESSCVSDRWWTKVPEIILRALSWRRKAEFNQYEYLGELFRKAPIELAPTKDEVQCNCRAAKKKSSEDLHPSECVREASLIDRVRDLECICETLLTLPKEVKSLRGRIHKLEIIIQSTFYPLRVFKKQETLKIDVPQIKYYLQSTSEDEPCIKDQTSHKPDDEVAEQKIQSEIQRLYNHREARLNKIAKEDKQRKCLGHINSSAHIKLDIERCVPKKRKFVDVLRSPYRALPKILNVPSFEQLANQKNVLNPLMIENAVVGRCKFPWFNDITVDRSFWNGLCALDDNRTRWLLDEVFIPINEPLLHWSLVMFHICSGVVTFYDSERTKGEEYCKWYLQIMDCLEENIHVVLNETGVFEKKNINPTKYKISFKVADRVSKQ